MSHIIAPGPSALLPTYPPYPFPIVGGAGDHVFDADGNAYLDLYGGHCVCSTGHAHPRVAKALADQATQLLFYSTAATLPIRDEAANRLAAFAPDAIARVFFCNSGAEANENALKVAVKRTGRKRFVAFRGGWHGRTLLALSVTDDPPLRAPLEGLLAPVTFLPFGDTAALDERVIGEAAAVILEPIQSMAGVVTAAPAWFAALRDVCTRTGTLLVFDEVQTGMGRTGAPFAAQLYGVTPDMMTTAKGIASGVPMGALLMTDDVAAGLGRGDLGSTFGGGPLAAAALIATLDVIHDENLVARAADLEGRIRAGFANSPVRAVRGAGMLLGLDVGPRAAGLKAWLQGRHILVGGSHDPNVLRIMAPLTLRDESVSAFILAVRTYLESHP